MVTYYDNITIMTYYDIVTINGDALQQQNIIVTHYDNVTRHVSIMLE